MRGEGDWYQPDLIRQQPTKPAKLSRYYLSRINTVIVNPEGLNTPPLPRFVENWTAKQKLSQSKEDEKRMAIGAPSDLLPSAEAECKEFL